MLNPGFGTCGICGLPWNICEIKSVNTSNHESTFSTCQYCWDKSSLDEIKKSYSDTWTEQHQSLIRLNDKMKHTRIHLLDCVEKEFDKENIKRRKQKIRSLKRKIKKNVTLH